MHRLPLAASLFALGQTRNLFLRSVTRLVGSVIGSIPAGWYFAGVKGVIWGTVIAEVPTVFTIWPRSRSLGILRVRRELLAIGIFAGSYLVGRLVMPWLPVLHLRK